MQSCTLGPWERRYDPYLNVLPSSSACTFLQFAACVLGLRPLFRWRAVLSRHARNRRPRVADEMSLPTVAWSKTGDVPPAKELDISGEISKRITEDFGVSIGSGWTQIRQPGSPTVAGFDNLETAFQYQLLKDAAHETAMLLGLVVEWGGTGAIHSGIAEPFSTLTPTYYSARGSADFLTRWDGQDRSQ